MGDGKSSHCLLLPMHKRRKVSAVRDFPKGLKQLSDIGGLKSTRNVACGSRDEYWKANGSCGSENVKEFKQYSEELVMKSKRDEACGLKNAKEFKGSTKELDLKVKGGDAFGSKNANKFKGSSKEFGPKVKGDEAFGSKNVQEFKRCSEKLGPKIKEDEAYGSKNVKEFKRCSEEFDPKSNGDEASGSKNAKGSSKELDLEDKGDKTFGSKNVQEFNRCSEKLGPNVKEDEVSGSKNVKEFKRCSEEFDPKSKGDEAGGSRNAKEFRQCSEEFDLKSKGGEACESKNAKEFKGSSKELDPKVKGHEVSGSKNVKEFKRCSEEFDTKSKADEGTGSKNAKEFKGSSEELDQKVKRGEAFGSKNESFKPKKLHEAFCEREVDFEDGVLQLGTKKLCRNGDKNTVIGLKNKQLAHQVIGGVKSSREEQKLDSEQDVNDLSCLKQQCAYDNGNNLGSRESLTCQEIGSSLKSFNLTRNMHHTLPKRRKVSAIRSFPPELLRVMALHMNTEMADGATNNLSAIGHGYRKSENVGEHFKTDENQKDMDLLKTDDFSHCKANEMKRSSSNSDKELLVDKVEMVEPSCSDIVVSSDVANMLEPECGINNVEIDGQLHDKICMDVENQEFYHPRGHNSPALNDVQESTCQLDGPNDMFLQAPNVADFFSDDCYNGFLFEDDVEPSETNRQSDWQDGSEEVLKTAHQLGTVNHGIKAIADSGDDEKRLQVNTITNEASKTDKLSISGKQKEDVCSLLIPQKNHVCKNTQGSSLQRFSSVGGSVSKDNPTKHGKGQVEGGGNSVGKVKHMPEKEEARKSFEKCNNFPSGEVYKKALMNCASEKIAGRDVIQGLMAAKRCPWKHSKGKSNIIGKDY